MTIGTFAIFFATLLAGVTLVAFGLWRPRQRPEPAGYDLAEEQGAPMADYAPHYEPVQDSAEVAAALAARVEGMIAEQARRQADVLTVALAGLKADIQHLKTDVEWLAGERMIEQAIQLAQSGLEPDDIGRELGLTRDTAHTIATFRKH
jgi:hypothetical protein